MEIALAAGAGLMVVVALVSFVLLAGGAGRSRAAATADKEDELDPETQEGEEKIKVGAPSANPLLDHIFHAALAAETGGGTADPDAKARDGWRMLDGYQGDTADLSRAASQFGEALAADPDHPGAWVGLAEAALHASYKSGTEYDQDGLRRGEGLIDRALKIVPSDSDALAVKAWYRALQRDTDTAASSLPRIDATNWRAPFLRALLARLRQDDAAFVDAQKAAASMAPPARRPALWNGLGSALIAQQRYEEAIEALDLALIDDPSMVWAWYNRGIALAELGAHDDALEAYDKCIELADFPPAREGRAKLLASVGNWR